MKRFRQLICLFALAATPVMGAEPEQNGTDLESKYHPTPARGPEEGEGPFRRLVIRGGTVIDGTGAPPRGPVDIVIEGNRIVDIVSLSESDRYAGAKPPEGAVREIDARGAYVLPGLVDTHVHTPGYLGLSAEYAYKLWLAHGVTTVRGVPAGPFDWALDEKRRSARNEIVAPRLVVYQRPGMAGAGSEWRTRRIVAPEDARDWVRYAAGKGVDGVKFRDAYFPEVMKAAIDEAHKHKMGTTAHLVQIGVAEVNALDAARLGLDGVTHFYGLFESLYKDHDVQPWPANMNYSDEQDRFAQVARQWNMVHERGSPEWNAVLEEFLEHDYYVNPTMSIYVSARDVMAARTADWHDAYTSPALWKSFQASRESHCSFWYYWTTADEVAWRNYYRVWLSFLNDYKNKGGKVTLGTDSGFCYAVYGFGAVMELELLQEAGFHPLEAIRSATMHAAMEIAKPTGKPIEYGVIRRGMLADMFIVEENPVENFKVLYGTGARKLNDGTGEIERIGGVTQTIKDGIVYDAKRLLQDVAESVAKEKSMR